jgi:drug/metabolite transporter (DMT)-like permease
LLALSRALLYKSAMARTGDSAVLMTPGAAVGQEAAHATVERETRRAVLRLSLGLAVIVMTPILFRLSALGPTATAFHRTFFAIPLFAAWMALERRSAMRRGEIVAPLRLQRDGLALVIGGVFFAANIVGYAWAVHFTSVANASLLSNMTPIFVALGSFLVFRERVSRSFVAALAAAILGVAVLTGDRLELRSDQLLGDALALSGALFYAGYLMVICRLRLRLSAATIMTWSAGIAALCQLAAALAAREALLPVTLQGWAVILILSLVNYGMGQGLITLAMARIGATFSSVAMLSLPVGATILAWVLLGEALSLNQGIGGVVILASIYAARRASRR